MKYVIDVKQRRPGCVLLQAALGGDRFHMKGFPTSSWLLAPTDDMHLVSGTEEEWEKFTEELTARGFV